MSSLSQKKSRVCLILAQLNVITVTQLLCFKKKRGIECPLMPFCPKEKNLLLGKEFTIIQRYLNVLFSVLCVSPSGKRNELKSSLEIRKVMTYFSEK